MGPDGPIINDWWGFQGFLTWEFMTRNVGHGYIVTTKSPKCGCCCSKERWIAAKRAKKGAARQGDREMLALLTIFLASVMISVLAIWIYRTANSWGGASTILVGRRGKNVRTRLKPQQGFISLHSPSKRQPESSRVASFRGKASRAKTSRVKTARLRAARARSVYFRNSTATIKAPWGWWQASELSSSLIHS